jgi:hypothetical protein
MSWMPGTPEARAAEQEKRAISDFAMKPWAPRAMAPSSGDPGGPRILQSFDVKRGPGKQPWNLDRLARLISEAFAASPGATLMVLATYAAGAGDSEEGRRASGENRDAAAENAEVVSRALAEWMPIPKGRISTSIEAKDTGRTFGLPAEAAGELGAREVSVIVLPR